ncbi:MAG: zinc ribbon domain-containing protein [Actinomycetota bacterium]|nr:zinc ribbon domain-containing protein [Actinomycetota bacterium]
MRVEDVEILTDDRIGRPYEVLGLIEARVTAGAAWNKARTVEDVNSKLREVALRMGANAVLNTRYERGISMTSWKALTARGWAVRAESVDKQCPFCAETIKRAASVCRFCGRDLPPQPEN